jgi:hypothetical protein
MLGKVLHDRVRQLAHAAGCSSRVRPRWMYRASRNRDETVHPSSASPSLNPSIGGAEPGDNDA